MPYQSDQTEEEASEFRQNLIDEILAEEGIRLSPVGDPTVVSLGQQSAGLNSNSDGGDKASEWGGAVAPVADMGGDSEELVDAPTVTAEKRKTRASIFTTAASPTRTSVMRAAKDSQYSEASLSETPTRTPSMRASKGSRYPEANTSVTPTRTPLMRAAKTPRYAESDTFPASTKTNTATEARVSSRISASASAAVAAGPGGRKRKATEMKPAANPTPAKRRDRPQRAAARNAILAIETENKLTSGSSKSAFTDGKNTKPPSKRGRPSKNRETDGNIPSGEYEVEAILKSKFDEKTREKMYLIKWKGYPLADTTWEPKKHLAHAADMVQQFEAKGNKGDAAAVKKERAAGLRRNPRRG